MYATISKALADHVGPFYQQVHDTIAHQITKLGECYKKEFSGI